MTWTDTGISLALAIGVPLVWATAVGCDARKRGDRAGIRKALSAVAASLSAGLIAGLLIFRTGDKPARRTIDPRNVQGIAPEVIPATTDTASGN